STPSYKDFSSGKSSKILSPELIATKECKGFRFDGRNAWGKSGLVIGKMKDLPKAYYQGEIFDDNIHAIIPKEPQLIPAIRAFIEFGDFSAEVRRFNQKLAITSSAVV